MSEAAAKPQVHETNIKETIESILVAFVLAFIFRCFVVEAFVIPTGSMAPTLMGAHMAFDCPDCGYKFTVGYGEGDRNSMFVPDRARVQVGDRSESRVMAIFCPNCGYRLPRVNPEDPDQAATAPPVRYGDRILVMKYAYLLNPARRWDVVVFKSPQTQNDNDSHPQSQQMMDYSVNYIKRLVGLPGESLFVAGGDLYVCPPGADYTNLDNYKVQTKPRYAQDALWRIVYDADYLPRNLDRTILSADGQPFWRRRADATNPTAEDKRMDFPWAMPWVANDGSGWTLTTLTTEPRRFVFDNPKGSGSLLFDEKVTPQKGAMTDWLAYDVTNSQYNGIDTYTNDSYAMSNIVFPVSDLKISCFVDEIKDDGVLNLQLQKGDVLFTAELKRGQVRLFMQAASHEPVEIGKVAMELGDRPAKVEFENVDYRVTLRLDGKEVISTTSEQYAPDLHKLVAETKANRRGPYGAAMMNARNGRVQLSHVQLWRDVYYRDFDSQVLRATSYNFPNRVVTLSPTDYFVLGDNSAASSDARMWTNSVNLPTEDLKVDAGRVPERFMLGRAFFVYWPAGYRPGSSLPPLIPNFGRMRFIH